jgi:hypothetical protein
MIANRNTIGHLDRFINGTRIGGVVEAAARAIIVVVVVVVVVEEAEDVEGIDNHDFLTEKRTVPEIVAFIWMDSDARKSRKQELGSSSQICLMI